MADKVRVVVRHIIMLLCFWLPASRRKKIERWLRGREEYKKLQRSDWVLMSWGKSGRTWLRVMLSRSTWDFVLDKEAGVPRIVEYFNGWAQAIPELKDVLVVRYEDMRTDPGVVLAKIMEFTGTAVTAEQVREAVDFAAYDNMKKMEQDKFFKGSGARVKPGDKDNPQSFKVRKAKVGGYRDYFTDEQCEQLQQMVAQLDPMFGYGGERA